MDLSGIVINAVQGAIAKKEKLSESLVRHVTISQILHYKKKYNKYGLPIICIDSRHYWRKDEFKYYKQNRKKARSKSTMDWELFFEYFNIVKQELKDFLPYIVLEIKKCEADDIIYLLAMKCQEPVMVVSADKDFLQIQTHKKNVKQYSPMVKKLISLNTNSYSLIEHIIRGDSSDGIPNIKSDEDTFMHEHKRQRCISTILINDAERLDRTELICENKTQLDAYKRNQKLIDMANIPDNYKKEIREAYKNAIDNPPKNRLRSYFIKKRMRLLFNKLNEFK